MAGISERIRRMCKDFNIRAVLKFGPTFRSLLTKVKDPLPMEKQANVIYKVLCTCGTVYINDETSIGNLPEGASGRMHQRLHRQICHS